MNVTRWIETTLLLGALMLSMATWDYHDLVAEKWADAHEQDYRFLKAWKTAHEKDRQCITTFTIVPMHPKDKPCHPLVIPWPMPMPEPPERSIMPKNHSRIA